MKLKCINKYKETLKASVPKITSLYDGYLQNYSSKDGSLIKKFDQPKEIKDSNN